MAMASINFIFSTLFNLFIALALGISTGTSLLLAVRLAYKQAPKLTAYLLQGFSSDEFQEIYTNVIIPYRDWLNLTLVLVLLDGLILVTPTPAWLTIFESPLGLAVAVGTTLLGFKIFESFFAGYLLEKIFGEQKKIDSELLALIKVLAKSIFALVVVFIFAQTHSINVLGLAASVGIGGVILAFASQRVLEQLLWSITLYLDRPFSVDDYIHLPDGTIGRVEATGWRSTKIRLSGKNTLAVIPNSNLAQVSIENLTRARRAIAIVELTFEKIVPDDEKALVHQIVRDSTSDILGIDPQLTQVDFASRFNLAGELEVFAKAIFFVLGSAGNSMNLRRSLLEIARSNIVERLELCGISCEARDSIVDVSQPMNF